MPKYGQISPYEKKSTAKSGYDQPNVPSRGKSRTKNSHVKNSGGLQAGKATEGEY